MPSITRRAYAEMYGPTTGDRIRLADTELFIEIEKDFALYGEEVKFGGGKVIRDGMGQSQRMHADVMDTVITNAVIIDHWGIVKADIGIKNGLIAATSPFLMPRSALTMPQWSTITALVITVSITSAWQRCDWPMPSRITLPPPNLTSSP